jgi:hypothetical protein
VANLPFLNLCQHRLHGKGIVLKALRKFLFFQHKLEIFEERLKVFLMGDLILEYLQNHIVSNGVFPLSGGQQTLVKSDRAALALNVLIENGFYGGSSGAS